MADKKRRGRPPSINGRRSKKWEPKKWTPVYDKMVALSCTGASNKYIAEQFGYSDQQVCDILNSPQAQIVNELIRKQVFKAAEKNILHSLGVASDAAASNIKKVLTNSELLEKHPFQMVDRSIAFLKGVGRLNDSDGEKKAGPTIVLNNQIAINLMNGLKEANEAAKMHGIDITPAPEGS